MNKLTSLLGLCLLLVACGQSPSAPTALYPDSASKPSSLVSNFETQVASDLQRLGLAGTLTEQNFAAPKSYLNVLKLSSSAARAYIKTTYPQNTPCSLDWGDGSSGTVMTPTPSTMNTQTQDHAYASGGTYAIKLTCGSNVKTVNFTAVVPASALDFEDLGPVVGQGGFEFVQSPYIYKGIALEGPSLVIDNSIYLPQGHTGFCLCDDVTIRKADNSAFTFKSITVASSGNEVTLTGFGSNDQVIGQVTFNNQTSAYVTLMPNWAGVTRVVSTGGVWWMDDLTLGQ
ncbi:hypothetical protein [Deinococcus aerophilus]|uniref:PKD domain-containing protein n=1 Tax=Deinococcus aerophilus TaxID=522488 RepID=A0ABQ2GXX4_9DEIO|nr:hypothetical protein [Deinococcus aerophilus]GGM16769.1 hypothetical protein GCM10010841_26340 [Deinococcus aerophilus]